MLTRLQDLADRLVAAAPAGSPPGALPPVGAVLALHTPAGEQVAVAGARTLGPDDPMTPGTVHDLASVTKVAGTTAAVMRLVSDGLLRLDTRVGSLLPAFAGGHKDDVTVRDLLDHRSGMQEWWPLYLAIPGAGPDVTTESSREAAFAVVDRLALRYPPGAAHHYSDLGFLQLGRIVSVVTGLSLPVAVRTLVHEPLGLGLGYGPEPLHPVAASAPDDRVEKQMIDSGVPYPVPYSSADFPRWRETTIRGQVHDGNTFHALGGVSGHAGLFGTVPDLLALAVALAHPHRHEAIWSPAVVDEFYAARRSPLQALGFRRYPVQTADRVVEFLGHPGFVGAALAFVPDVGREAHGGGEGGGVDVAVALGTNRLLRGGTAVPTELLLRDLLAVAMAHEPIGPAPRTRGLVRPRAPRPPAAAPFPDPSRGTS